MPGELPEEFAQYKCWVFDCDGVLLDSNRVKTDAFCQAVLGYGSDAAEELVRHHVAHGGVSRFKKFDYFFSDILKRAPEDSEMETVLEKFSAATKDGLLTCNEAPGLRPLLEAIPAAVPRFVVSGGAQDELREVFAARGLAAYFTAVFGSPDTKETILKREADGDVMEMPGVFVGDSKYDFDASSGFGFDFIFVTDWTEFAGWESYFKGRPVKVLSNIGKLLIERGEF